MTKPNQNLLELDPEIYYNNEGKSPVQFTLTIPNVASQTTLAAGVIIQNKLMELPSILDSKFELLNEAFDGKKLIDLSPMMLMLKLEYTESPPRWLIFTFNEEAGGATIH